MRLPTLAALLAAVAVNAFGPVKWEGLDNCVRVGNPHFAMECDLPTCSENPNPKTKSIAGLPIIYRAPKASGDHIATQLVDLDAHRLSCESEGDVRAVRAELAELVKRRDQADLAKAEAWIEGLALILRETDPASKGIYRREANGDSKESLHAKLAQLVRNRDELRELVQKWARWQNSFHPLAQKYKYYQQDLTKVEGQIQELTRFLEEKEKASKDIQRRATGGSSDGTGLLAELATLMQKLDGLKAGLKKHEAQSAGSWGWLITVADPFGRKTKYYQHNIAKVEGEIENLIRLLKAKEGQASSTKEPSKEKRYALKLRS